MNQFFYQITRKASDLINSDDYRERNITRQNAFTRNRKLSFPVMIVLLLNFLTRTMQIESFSLTTHHIHLFQHWRYSKPHI